MTHQTVIENFVDHGIGRKGHYVISDDKGLYSRHRFTPGPTTPHRPLAFRLKEGGILANGDRLTWPENRYQETLLQTLEKTPISFGVVPFDSITSAWTNGEHRDWRWAPFTLRQLLGAVRIVVPSSGERWRKVKVKDKYGRENERTVHALGDSVIEVNEHLYLSGVDETGSSWNGSYFLAELRCHKKPASIGEAYAALKPKVVLEAEARGLNVRRQGEWFAIPTNLTTSALLREVERGMAVRREEYILGTDGHHQLEEAVTFEYGPRKGEVYARGLVVHTNHEHENLDLGFRWHLIVHNVQGRSYSLAGNFD